MDTAQFVELLQALNSHDNNVRQNAETMYQQAKESEPSKVLIGLMSVVGSPEAKEGIKTHSSVLLRQLMQRGPEKSFLYARLDGPQRLEVAAELLRCYEHEQNSRIRRKIGEVVSKLAEFVCDPEDPRGHLVADSNGWPALLPLVFRLACPSSALSASVCEDAMRLLKEILPTLKNDIVAAKAELGQVIQGGLAHSELKLRSSALLLVCEIVQTCDKASWAPLLQTAGALMQVMQQMAAAKEEELLQEAIQAFIDVASVEPEFFKGQLTQSLEPATFMSSVAKVRDGDSGLRNMALEWMVTYIEKRAKWVAKSLPALAALALEVCMELMFEVEPNSDAWVLRMDDEEGEEDDELLKMGQEAIDRVASALPIEAVCPPLFALVGRFATQEQWQSRHAALAAVKQTAEYIEEKAHVDEMAKLLLQHLEHAHPRVRYTALHAIGQVANDQAPHFQESWHATVIPVLIKMMDDPVDRVAAMAMSAFTSFGEPLDGALMATYAEGLMNKLVGKLQSSQHRGVREESITCIAVIAGVIGEEFKRYYDQIMPILKQLVMHATGEKENRLRGKAFECLSLLGIAVGKEKFLPDASEALSEMMNSSLDSDDVQREYIKEASERIVQCLKKDFAPFLPALMRGVLSSLKLDDEGKEKVVSSVENGADARYVEMSTGDGGLVTVRSQRLEEVMQSVQLVCCFAYEMEGAFCDWVPDTAQALLPLLSFADEMSMVSDETQAAALHCWALLVKSARLGAEERGAPSDVPRDLVRTAFQNIFALTDKCKDADKLAMMASGMTECVKGVGPGVLGGEEVKQIAERLFVLIDQSQSRSNKADALWQGHKSGQAGLPQELDDECGDDQDEQEWSEEQLRRNYEETLGALMQVALQEFLPCLPQCGSRIQQWLGSKRDKVLALYLVCDLFAHLKEASEPIWPTVMPQVLAALSDQDPDARNAAAYAVNMASKVASFADVAPKAFETLAQVLNGPKPKKKDDKAKVARDNAVAATLALATACPGQCPAGVDPWLLILLRLPMRDDVEEAKKTHAAFVDLVLAQHQGLLGAGGVNLGQVLSVLAEMHRVESICTKETDEKIKNVFKHVPTQNLQACASKFSEKQQRKIEKMLAAS